MRKIFLFFTFFISFISFGQKNQKTIGFIENKGQIVDQKGKANKAVQYLLNTSGLNVQLRKNGFSYDVYETKKIPLTKKDKSSNTSSASFNKEKETPDFSLEYNYHRIDIDFLNSNSSVKLVAEEKSTDYDNYYNVAHAPEGVTNVHKYQKVTYQNIYNNIDVVFFIPKDTTKVVEYNFVVKPGGKVSDIQLKFDGAKTELADNKIKMTVRFGQMEETLPLSWTEQGTSRKEIAISYIKIKKNVYGFEGDVNASDKTIVIDPVPVRLWGTYYGGEQGDFALDICNDKNNNAYIAGYTYSSINIATTGSYIIQVNQANGVIAKFDTNGVRIWGIYYAASPKSINVDSNLNLYFTGSYWGEIDITTPGSHQPLRDDYEDAILVKLNPAGIREWGTYYGGDKTDRGNDLCFDSLNNIYLVGFAESWQNISTSDAHQLNHSPNISYDGFIVKFNPLGTRVWGTYLGGLNDDIINSCNVSDDGYLYITGNTYSNDGIATSGSYQSTLIGYNSGMIAKFTLNGQRIWGTYFVGTTSATIVSSKMHGNNLYLVGTTNSFTNLNSANTFNETFQHLPMQFGRSSFIAKFDTNSQSLLWGTYFGEIIQDLDVNSNDRVIITGCTTLPDGIATAGSYAETNQSGDAYMIKFTPNGQREWGTYYGGNFSEGFNGVDGVCNKISIDDLNNIYLIGSTDGSTTGISTPGAHQETNGPTVYGQADIFLAKFQDCLSSPQVSAQNICIGNNLQLNASGGSNYSWTGPNGFTSDLQNPIITNADATHSGQYICTITGTGGCDGPASVTVLVGDTTAPVPNLATLPTVTGDCNTIIATFPTATDNCAGSIIATTTSPLNYSIPGTYTIVWNYNDGNGNTSTQNQTVVISATALPTLTSPQKFCIQQNVTLNGIAITGLNIKWYDALTGGTLLANNTLLQNGVTYYASQTINGCESARVPVTITIQNTPAPTGNAMQSFCSSQNATLNDLVVSGTAITWYDSAAGTTVLPLSALVAHNTTYYATQTINGCESPTRLAVTVSLINTLNATDYAKTFCDDLDNGFETLNLSDYNTYLISSTANHTFTYYTSENGAENQIPTEAITNINNYSLTVGLHTVYVRIDSPNGCHQVVELALTLARKPIIPITDIMPICEGSSITVNAGIGYDSYLWSTSETTPSITITSPGNYSVTVTEDHGAVSCSSVKNFTVVNSNVATISYLISSDWTSNENTITVMISAAMSFGNYEYSLDGIHYQDSHIFTGLESGEYTVYVKDKNGCGIATEDVYLLMYPKFFTPNGDGFNDTWRIRFTEDEPGLLIKIFDRFGKLLKQIDNDHAGWNGMFNDQPLPATDYWFTVTRANGKEYKGHFALKR